MFCGGIWKCSTSYSQAESRRHRGRNQAEKAVEKFRVENCNSDLIVPLCDILSPVLKYCLRNLT